MNYLQEQGLFAHESYSLVKTFMRNLQFPLTLLETKILTVTAAIKMLICETYCYKVQIQILSQWWVPRIESDFIAPFQV